MILRHCLFSQRNFFERVDQMIWLKIGAESVFIKINAFLFLNLISQILRFEIQLLSFKLENSYFGAAVVSRVVRFMRLNLNKVVSHFFLKTDSSSNFSQKILFPLVD